MPWECFKGCCVGWNLTYAIGNVPLKLHDWQVDFAYLNGEVFVHSNHFNDNHLTKLDSWWNNRESTRFTMFDSMKYSFSFNINNVYLVVDIDRDRSALDFH
ncbi:unnamed protein product, partial [Rotaria sp. Silwood2]